MSSTRPHMSRLTATTQRATAAQPSLRLGERLRQLRVAAGMTQTDLAGERFSKEYVSQIERGKTRPTPETIDWLAVRLGVDAGFLANGVSADERGRVDAVIARAEALLEARRNPEAIEEFANLRSAVLATGLADRRPRGPLGARSVVRGAREGDLRGARGSPQPRPADEQPRRPQFPPRSPGRGRILPQGRVPDRTRDRQRRRRRARGQLPGA